ncbi:hypothetical protein LIER_02641 [Lithospermum erythrorhizon]|uniref:Uncharacterized protein n=1 Tax=Lithospermum erythrorhizon TaxID=34254 RepID=A0AAV3NUU4_LITER
MIKNQQNVNGSGVPAFVLYNLPANTFYSFSGWVKIEGVGSSVIRVTITTDNSTFNCIGNVVAKDNCWSFLKGGFNLDSTAKFCFHPIPIKHNSLISNGGETNKMRLTEKCSTTVHVSDAKGNRLQGAVIITDQVSWDFPFGSAIDLHIIENTDYQNWFIERFNAAVFEAELKWYSTEPNKEK